jgi:hypothetical protein
MRQTICKAQISHGAKEEGSTLLNNNRKSRKKINLEERSGVLGKECTNCGDWVPLGGYFKHEGRLGGVRSQCKSCMKGRSNSEYSKRYRKENKGYFKEKLRDWRNANKEKVREASRNRYLKNKPKILEQVRAYQKENREYLTLKIREWQSKNEELLRLYVNNRRARVLLLPHTLTANQISEIIEYFDGCSLTDETSDFHLDHVIPLATGHGGTTVANIIPLRSDLNLSKHTSNIFEWFEANRQRFELSQERFDNLIDYLASANAMTVEEYRDYVYWCHANPRSIDELENDKEVM